MRISKLHDSDEMINGRRPSPLRISKDSHGIHKSSSFSGVGASKNHGGVKRPPVIIYTQSPRIIHTQAHEFMTLVQKLTGLDRAPEEKEENESESTADDCSISNEGNKYDLLVIKNNHNSNTTTTTTTNNNSNFVGYEENESSSVVTTDEKFVAHDSSPVSSVYTSNLNNNPYLIDGPFLASGSGDFYCSSRSNSMFGSADHHQISPSFMDIMKGFPEY